MNIKAKQLFIIKSIDLSRFNKLSQESIYLKCSNKYPCSVRSYSQQGNHEDPAHESTEDYKNQQTSYRHQESHRRSYEEKKRRMHMNSNKQDRSDIVDDILGPTTHYGRLSVEKNASLENIKSAYYGLSKIHHPDIAGNSEEAAEKFRLLTESYDVLSDAKSRFEYDQSLGVSHPHRDIMRTPSGRYNDEFHLHVRKSHEDLINILKNRSALELEKRENPRKFQAGNFDRTNLDAGDLSNIARDLRYSKRVQEARHYYNTTTNSRDDSFYSRHFWAYQDKRLSGGFGRANFDSTRDTDDVGLGMLMSFAVMASVIGLLSIFLKDVGGWMDEKVKLSSQKTPDQVPPTETR